MLVSVGPVGADVHVRAKSLNYLGLIVFYIPNRLEETLLGESWYRNESKIRNPKFLTLLSLPA